MKLPLAILLLAATALLARVAAEEAAHATPEALREQMAHLQAEAQEMESFAATQGELPAAPFDPNSPMPEPPPGQSAAAADGGLLFDNENSRLSYIGNVRLNDPHLRLRAAHSLYIHLPKNEKKEEKATPAAAAKPKSPAKPAAEKKEPKEQPAEPIPAYVTAETAAVDAPGSRALLIGRKAAPSLTLNRGQDSVELHPMATGAPAHVFSNAEGDVLIEGSDMLFVWHDEKGEPYKLEAATGPIIYTGKTRRLLVQGKARLTSATGALVCDRQLILTFAEAESHKPRRADTPFAAFSAMQFKQVEGAVADGHVELTTPATATRPAGTAKGDHLTYDAATGDCTLSGDCHLTYGGHSLTTQGEVHLLPNGDAAITGSGPICGTYERPHPDTPAAAPIRGEWSTPGSIQYNAQQSCYILPGGLSTKDALSTFSCSDELQLFTTAKPGATAPQPRPGMPNLAIAAHSEVQRVIAHGDVCLRSLATAKQPAMQVDADTLDATLPTGEATLTSSAGRRIYAQYGQYLLTATAAAEGEALVHLLPNGDLQAEGGQIAATLPGEKGASHVECQNFLRLQREQAILTLGENSRINSPEGILTARAPLTAELTTGEGASRAPAAYPQLSYNFTGLHRATTPGGGTVRTTQASLQCEGEMALELIPGADVKDNPRKNLRTASARNRVSVAGKDSTGRLIRATGDRLDFEPSTGNFYLRGSSVSLVDKYNTHTATGAGACVTIDPHNNVHITGRHHTTTANRIPEQMEHNKKK